MKDYKEALQHFFNTDMLNAKGLRNYINVLQEDILNWQERIQKTMEKGSEPRAFTQKND